MRARGILAALLATLLTILILLRHHIRDLSEMARTYATFYPYIARHPETLHRYPQPAGEAETRGDGELAPQIIHQIFLTEGRPSTLAKYQPAIDSCRNVHQNWTHNLWTDERGMEFMAEHYPDILPHYQGYKQSIQRANILRYALLEHFGGVYLDVDVTCLQPLDGLRHLPFVTPGAYPAGVNNAFILTRPGHSFLRHLLAGVESRNLFWGMPYVENMLSTGCMFFSNRWMSYVRSLTGSGVSGKGHQVYILADGYGNMDPHMLRGATTTPLFKHGGASSWHGWDAAAIVLIGKHYVYFLSMMALGAVFASVLVWRLTRRTRARGRSPLRKNSDKKSHDEERLVGVKEY